MRLAYRLRDRLGDEFLRMQNLAVLYSGLSYVSRFMGDWGLGRSEKWRRHVKRLWHLLQRTFVRRNVPISELDWARISDHAYDMAERAWQEHCGRRSPRTDAGVSQASAAPDNDDTDRGAHSGTTRRHRKARRRHPGLDIQYLPKAFEWLPEPDAARNTAERNSSIRLHRELLNVTLSIGGAGSQPVVSGNRGARRAVAGFSHPG